MENKSDMREKPCNIIIEGRKKISVSGVEDVDCFDEDSIVLITTGGNLTVTGSDFHINKLSVETGELIIDGSFDGCKFDEAGSGGKGGFFSKMFK